VLPNVPRRARAGRKSKKIATSVVLGVIGLVLGGGMIYYAAQWLFELVSDRQTWSEGVSAEFGEVSGEERSNRFVFHTYELNLSYVDAQGVRRELAQEFTTVFGEVDTDNPPEIRYLPDEPERAVSSWSVEVSVSRAVFAVLAFVMSLVIMSLVPVALLAIRDAVVEERAAIEGIETRATICSVNSDQHGNTTYVFRADVPSEGRTLEGRAVLQGKAPWLITETTAVALYLPSHHRAFLVENDGAPIEFG
jgi:hypothetical protein